MSQRVDTPTVGTQADMRVHLWGQVLSPQEITALQNAGAIPHIPSTGVMFVADDRPAPSDFNTDPAPLVLEIPVFPRVFADVGALIANLAGHSDDTD